MYTSTEDARSDLFLAGAVFLFGGLILSILLRIVPLQRVPVLGTVLEIVLPLVTTVLVPYLLIRYRKEPWSMYGLAGFSPSALGYGVLLGAPLVVAGVVGASLAGVSPASALPLASVASAALPDVVARITRWLGYALLAVYGTAKARDAFRGQPATVITGARQIGGILGIAVVAAVALLALSSLARGGNLVAVVELALIALGVGSALILAVSQTAEAATTSRPALVTPAVLLGLAGFHLSFNALAIVTTVYLTGLLAMIGLVIGVLQESRRTAWPAVGLALVLATLTTFGGTGLR